MLVVKFNPNGWYFHLEIDHIKHFYKNFKELSYKIRITINTMIGHADPTNGHGGYSFIKKPQKERTDKD